MCQTYPKFCDLELVFRDTAPGTSMTHPMHLRRQTGSMELVLGKVFHWGQGGVEMLRTTGNPTLLSPGELEARGRYWSDYDHLTDEYCDRLEEGTVFRISKGYDGKKEKKKKKNKGKSEWIDDELGDISPAGIFRDPRRSQTLPHERGLAEFEHFRRKLSPSRSHGSNGSSSSDVSLPNLF
ncbi:hypothetical protein TWF694_009455 [Orbilia ellipsospora]|uniref:Uncharacterized protein n=1 Tax=Orbilia ellipsospora TaxID=2528407 RepID=A0AAV9XAU0_9PEZI